MTNPDYVDFFLSMTRSDTYRFQFVVKNQDSKLAASIGSWQQFWVTAKISLSDASTIPLFQLTLDDGIEIIDALNGILEATIEPKHTRGLSTEHHQLVMDIQGKSPGGDIYTL